MEQTEKYGLQEKKSSEDEAQKKIKETEEIFSQLAIENKLADENPGVLRISYDAKNKVSIGNFSRGGKNWTEIKAGDHDFSKNHITPFGLFLPELKQTSLYFTESRVTADFIVDVLDDFWQTNKKHF